MIKSIELDSLGSRLDYTANMEQSATHNLLQNASILTLATEARSLSARASTELQPSFQLLRRADA